MRPRMHALLLADDHKAIIEGLRLHFDRSEAFYVVGSATCGEGLLTLAGAVPADLLLIDMAMPVAQSDPATLIGAALIGELKRIQPLAMIVAYSGYFDEAIVEAALDAGADGYARKEWSLTDLESYVQKIVSGGLRFRRSDPGLEIVRYFKSSELRRPSENWDWDVKALLAGLNTKLLDERLRVGSELDRLGIKGKSISARFRRSVGISPKGYVASKRVQLARILLRKTKCTKTQAALTVGYSELSALTKAMKRCP